MSLSPRALRIYVAAGLERPMITSDVAGWWGLLEKRAVLTARYTREVLYFSRKWDRPPPPEEQIRLGPDGDDAKVASYIEG
jgi:hypothetical protein